MMTFPNWE
jgi:hypothetical protein